MQKSDLGRIVSYIVAQGLSAIKKYLPDEEFVLDYLDIFPKSEEELGHLSGVAETIGQEINKELALKKGRTFLLSEPIRFSSGDLHLIKIRKYDPTRPQRGAPDFVIKNYIDFKNRYIRSSGDFTLMLRKENYEMIELKGIDVLVYIKEFPYKV